jgi:Flp pilus assembly protein CpaB
MVFRRRVPRATVLFLLASVGCAFAAFTLMRGYAARLEALRPAVGPVVPVVVAAGPVERGATILPDDVRVEEVPATVAPPGAFGDPAHAIGRTTLTALGEGEAVTPTRLVGGQGGPLASLVPPGLRAVPIVVQSVPGGLVRGDRVDVISTYGEGRMYSETVGHELEVLVAPEEDTGGATSVGGDGGGTQLVVLADTATASRLARSSVASVLSIAVVGVDDG